MRYPFTFCCWLLCLKLIVAQSLPPTFQIDTTNLNKTDLIFYLEKIDSLEGALSSEQRKQVISFGYKMSKKLQSDSLIAVFGTRVGKINIFSNNPDLAQVYALESIKILEKKNNLSPQELTIIKKWFSDFTHWLTTSKNGNDAAENGNNHSTWWGAQVASYCSLTGNTEHYTIAEAKFIELLDHQMKEDGRFPEELDRTKPWHYMNYNIRAWANFALLLSNEEKDFWNLEGKNGTIKKAFDFNFNYLKSPADWPYQTELEKSPKIKPEDHFYMASKALQEPKYKTIWSQLIPQNGMNSGRLFLFSKLYDL